MEFRVKDELNMKKYEENKEVGEIKQSHEIMKKRAFFSTIYILTFV